MSEPGCVAVIGLGLIGGSIARDLAALGVRVLGCDHDPDTVRAAVAGGVVSGVLDADLTRIDAADLVVLAVPAPTAAAMLARLRDRAPEAVITDVGSTKRSIMAAAADAGCSERFVGSHPMAGDHRGGWEASRQGLFRGSRVYLTAAGAASGALERIEQLWALMGARASTVAAADHDRLLARTSHLPQVLSSALATVLAGDGIAPDELGPGGRDMTRLAASPAALWAGIALDNRDELGAAVASLQVALASLRVLLAAGNEAALREWFAAGRAWAPEPRSWAENSSHSVAAEGPEG